MKKVLFLATIALFISCATSVSTKVKTTYQRFEPSQQIYVLEKNETLPENSQFVGDVKIGDTGFSKDCGYNKVIADATNAARNAGANLLQITEVKEPTVLGSTCYRIKGKMYRNLNTESLAKLTEKRDLKNKSRIPAGSDYALIHFYRPSIGLGALLGYKIKDEKDSVIGRLRNGEKFVYKTKDFGSKSFYGVLETKEVVKINVEKGKEYFVRCAVESGVVMGRPEINLIETYIGRKEFEQMQ